MIFTEQNMPKQLYPYLGGLNSLYALYVQVMDLKRRKEQLDRWETFKAWGFVAYAYARDIAFNLVTGTRIFKDAPQEFTFTARLKRYRLGQDKEKIAIAELLCDQYLDQVDPSGDHC